MRFTRIGALAILAVAAVWSPAFATLHPGDQVAINVYNHPELTANAVVDSTGKVSVPLAGDIEASGLDTTQLANKIVVALEPYVIKPAVDVRLLSQNPTIFLDGGPGGTLTYRPGDTLVAGLAGVQLGQGVDKSKVTIVRDGKSMGPYNLDALASQGQGGPLLQPGDEIALANKPVAVKVQGAVLHPGMAYLDTGEPLRDAIAQVGGPTPNAANTQIVLNRGGQRVALSMGGTQLSEPAKNGDSIDVPDAVQVEVVGMVSHPGPVTLRNNFTLVSAIYEAGGPTQWADIRKVEVLHDGVKHDYNVTALTHGSLAQDPALTDGDVVFVPEGHKVDWSKLWSGILSLRWFFPAGHL